MHTKSDLRVLLKWMTTGSGSVIRRRYVAGRRVTHKHFIVDHLIAGISQMNSLPRLFFVTFAPICFFLSISMTVEAQSRVPLADAVKEFNRTTRTDQIGKSQPPLTVDEVIAAIRLIDIRKFDMAEECRDEYKLIASEKSIASVDKIKFTRGWGPLEIDGKLHEFNVWWIDLRIERDSIKDRFGRTPTKSNLRIRDRTISSRRLTESEVEEYENRKLAIEINQEEQRLKLLKAKDKE